ncbi:RNA 2',3'-cyclic phosphodiesterase [Massilia sp. CF038]|uniref:RNA 2',3'-cyclic phosphodiesterase n=1 Tax=Massilia sp. CF038 TaxID=1881045 RepID=UPI000917DCD2|nr:RNA 2',3'-cyclic phosphodiesterase [Massilia sp. CF038]SHH53167.1 2'-5' RNA ligase [Massilia sp. CF038]
MNARLFLALWPDPAVREQLAQARDRWTWPSAASPVRTERLHLTLHFIGDVAQERVATVADELALTSPRFDVHLGHHHLWPHGIAVLEPLHVPPALCALQDKLGSQLRALALPVDARSYRPHVTLARRAGNAHPAQGDAAIVWSVDRYALVQSQSGHYQVVREYAF